MTKQVQISCNFAQGQFGGGDYWVTITPVLARKIVALAQPTDTGNPKRTQAQRDAAKIKRSVRAWRVRPISEDERDWLLAIADRLENQ